MQPLTPRGPFRQAEEEVHSIKKKVTSSFAQAKGILFWPAVIFTHCQPAVAEPVGDWHSWQLLTSIDLDRMPLEQLLLEIIDHAEGPTVTSVRSAGWFDPGSPRPTKSDCLAIRKILRPDVHFVPAMATIRRDRIDEIKRFTDEQLEAIEGLDGVNARALVEGPAGTGKTVLALEEARRASTAGQRVLLTCYNQQLGRMLKLTAEELGNTEHYRRNFPFSSPRHRLGCGSRCSSGNACTAVLVQRASLSCPIGTSRYRAALRCPDRR